MASVLVGLGGQTHALASLSPVKESPYLLGKGLGEPQCRFGLCGGNFLTLPGLKLRSLGRPARRL
jgi:hypothetical protein